MMTLEDLQETLEEFFPNGFELGTDNDGQIVIYTHLMEDDDGDLVEYEPSDEDDEDDDYEDSDDEDEEDE